MKNNKLTFLSKIHLLTTQPTFQTRDKIPTVLSRVKSVLHALHPFIFYVFNFVTNVNILPKFFLLMEELISVNMHFSRFCYH